MECGLVFSRMPLLHKRNESLIYRRKAMTCSRCSPACPLDDKLKLLQLPPIMP